MQNLPTTANLPIEVLTDSRYKLKRRIKQRMPEFKRPMYPHQSLTFYGLGGIVRFHYCGN